MKNIMTSVLQQQINSLQQQITRQQQIIVDLTVEVAFNTRRSEACKRAIITIAQEISKQE